MRVEDSPASQLPLHFLCIISSYWFMGRMLSISLRQVHSATLCHQLVAYVLLVGRVETLLLCVDKMAVQLLRQLPHFKIPWYSLCSGLCFHFALCTCGHTCPLHQLGMFYGRNECAILWSQPPFPFTPWLTWHHFNQDCYSFCQFLFSPYDGELFLTLTSLFSIYSFILIS